MRLFRKIILYLLILLAMLAFFNIPVTTLQGIDSVIVARKIPLYVKSCGFLYRGHQYKGLARRITAGIETDMDKVMAIYNWTVENIKRHPEDLAVLDDHIWNVIIRRYGVDHQASDVFTILADYAGYEAFWTKRSLKDVPGNLILSFVKIGDRWHIFDVYNRRYLTGREAMESATPYGPTYAEYLKDMNKKVFKRHFRRADLQKVLPRIAFEVKKFFLGEGVYE